MLYNARTLRSAALCAPLMVTMAGKAQLTVTLAPTLYNGYHISCFGGGDGAIDLSVSGGTPPYTYAWSTGATTQDVANLRAGYISVNVRDSGGNASTPSLTLTEPFALRAEVLPYIYANGFNISCHNCYNGSIQVTPGDGVPPYTCTWADGPTTEDRSQLDAGNYAVDITDANGCVVVEDKILLTQPERDDWSKNGNAGSDPNTQFIGTTDNKDLVFKSNGSERLRLKSGGDVQVTSLMASGARLVYVDQDGILKRAGDSPPQMSHIPWYLGGNNDVGSSLNRIGPMDDVDFIFLTNGHERMRLTNTGRLGLGTDDPTEMLDVQHADERGGIGLTNVLSNNAHSEIRFSDAVGQRWALGCDMAANGGQDFFLWDELATSSRLRVDAAGRVLIGDAVPGTNTLYRLYVEGGIVSRDVKVTANNFPDYVFRKNYRLMPLDEVAQYIDRHGHLPHLPSAKEVEESGGFEVGDVELRLLRTVEEMQLYILELKEEVNALKEQLSTRQDGNR